ncbi:MAG TPA: DUF1631 domain-containing protein [Spongiibacteraceae bacterium]|nr:DUF1631 domain-containing protein [Spongiibacteraceae bacterium]
MTGPRSKIVPIKPGSGGSGKGRDGGAIDAMAAPLGRLQERCKQLLQQFVQALFDQADDALFELADRATHNLEQNMYFESMREVRIKRRGIEQAVARDVGENFRALTLGIASAGAAAHGGLENISTANLSLVEHDELEEIVAVDGMIAKAEKEFAESLALLTARIDALIAMGVTIKTNPFGPACLCQSFLQATHSLDLDIKAKLVLFKLFDRHVVKSLDTLYDVGNKLLVEEGVLPRLKRGGAQSSQSSNAGYEAGRDDSEAEQVFSSLQQLLGQARQEPGYFMMDQRSGLLAPGLAPALPRDALMQLLADIQQQQMVSLLGQRAAVLRGVVPQQLDVLQALSQALQQRLPNQAVSIGQVDDDAINLVSMLFQFILEDRNLAAPIKGLIARLQIPILKVAMLDKSFFSKGGHPARKLLNEMANASLGWVPSDPNGDVERDPFYFKIETLVTRIIDDFIDDVAVFQTALEDFVAFVEMDRRRATLIEQRTVDAEDGRAKSELARATVQQALNEKVAGKRLPSVVAKLLQEGWSNVMFLICLKEGVDSSSWRHANNTVDDLLESVCESDGPIDRAQLLRTLPVLLKDLRSGLNKIGFNPFDLSQLFTDLEQIHLQRLKKEEPAPAASSEFETSLLEASSHEASLLQPLPLAIETVTPPVQAAATSQTLDEVLEARQALDPLADLDRQLAAQLGETDEELLPPSADLSAAAMVAEPIAAATEPPAVPVVEAAPEPEQPTLSREQRTADRVDQLEVGNWVEFQQGPGKVVRCRLAAIIRATGKYIFVNRAGVKIAENNLAGLIKAYQRGELNLLDEGRLFDRALESVIGNLREMKNRPTSS